MRLTFNKNQLQSAVNTTMRAIPVRTTMPILECFLVEAQGETVTLTANDMEMAIKTTTPALIHEEGRIAVDAKLFSEIVRKLPEEEVSLRTDSALQVEITSGSSRFVIAGQDPADFVDMPEMDMGTPVVISQLSLKQIIEQTIFSVALNDNNQLMTGELFEIKGQNLRVAALDGHRIAIRNCTLNDAYEEKSVIVPGKTLQDVSRILSDSLDKEAELFLGKNSILFRFNDTLVMCRLIEGEYFRINQMLSKNYETKLTFNRRDFLSCAERSVLLVSERDKKPLVLDIRDGSVTLSLSSVIGSMNETLLAAKEGKDLMIGFNPRFLIDALRAIPDENVSLYLSNSRAPGYLKDEEETYIYLILPVYFVQNK